MFKKIIPEAVMVIVLTVGLVMANGSNPVATTPAKKATIAKSEACPPCPVCPDGKTKVKATTAKCKEDYCPPCPECPNGKYICKDEKCENTSTK